MRARDKTFLTLSMFLLALGASACEPKTSPKKKTAQDTTASTTTSTAPKATSPKETSPTAAAIELPEGVIARGEGFQVTVDDFDATLRRSVLLAPEAILDRGGKLPTEQFKIPFVQNRILESLISRHVADAEAKKRGITVSPEEVAKLIASDPYLNRFKKATDTNAPAPAKYDVERFGLTWQDVEVVARDRLLSEKLNSELIAELTEEQVWQAWRHAHDTTEVLLVRIANTPTSQEIDAVVKGEEEAIQAYFKANSKRFRTPQLTTIDTLRVPSALSLDKVGQRALLEKASAALATKSVEDVAREFELQISAGEQLVRQEDPHVAKGAVGDVGVTINAPRGTYAWKITARSESEVPALNRPLKREIASILIRERASSPTVKKHADLIIERLKKLDSKEAVMNVDTNALFADIDPELTRTRTPGPLKRDPAGFIPSVGSKPELLEKIFALSRKDHVLAPPVYTSQYAWTGVLIERNVPTREQFDANKEANMKAFREASRDKIFKQQLETKWKDAYKIERSFTPLQKRYGKIEKP